MSFWFSPDMGKYEWTNGKFYFETGLVTKETTFIRTMPSNHNIRYSTWTKKDFKREKKRIKKGGK